MTAALASGSPYGAVLSILSELAFGATAPPDAYGSATLSINGRPISEHDLGVFDDDVRPFWRDVEWVAVPLGMGDDVRLELILYRRRQLRR